MDLKYQRLFESNIVGIIIATGDGDIVEANDFFLDMLGYGRNDLPLHWHALTPLAWRDLDAARLVQVHTSGVSGPWEKVFLSEDGREVPALVGGMLLSAVQKDCIFVVHDLTMRKQVEQQVVEREAQLKALAAELLLAQERERRRIAGGLHDHLGQLLVLAKVKLGALAEMGWTADAGQPVAEIRALLDQALQAARTLTFELSSPILYELGLEAALHGLADEMELQHGLRVCIQIDDRPKPLADDVSILLYRMVSELLFNVVKHAHASQVSVIMKREGDRLSLAVEDDGRGFDEAGAGESFSPRGGFGLFSIRQQLDHIGGDLRIDTAAGGTRIVIAVPLG